MEKVAQWGEKLHNLYSYPNTIKQMKSRRMRWAGDVARMGGERKVYKFWWESSKEIDHSEEQGVDGWLESERILGILAEGVAWIRLAQNRDRWSAVVNAVMNLRVLAPRSFGWLVGWLVGWLAGSIGDRRLHQSIPCQTISLRINIFTRHTVDAIHSCG
jgi:hypothetical protein